jgi:hypothetical protein
MADMPTEVKECILNNHIHRAHIATKDTLSLALTQLPADDPLIVALSQDHHAYTATDSAYSDPTKMFPSSFQLLMDTSMMIIRHYFLLLSLQLLFYYFGGCYVSGGVLEFELRTHHVTFIYILY